MAYGNLAGMYNKVVESLTGAQEMSRKQSVSSADSDEECRLGLFHELFSL